MPLLLSFVSHIISPFLTTIPLFRTLKKLVERVSPELQNYGIVNDL